VTHLGLPVGLEPTNNLSFRRSPVHSGSP